MKNGLNRFGFYTQQVEELMNKAGEQRAPAMWLYKNNARTPFFMLEGLAKIYAGMHNTKKFGKLKEHFKLIEDGLGQIDYYNWLSIAFASKKQISAQCRQYARSQSDQRVILLNKVLVDEDWLADNNKRIKKITKKLSESNWLKQAEEVETISGFYEKSIADISEFVARTNYHFDNVEKDVHELRRKLRWLSIYPHALQGAIQYARATRAAAHLKKYLTEEIINSPYNKLPATGSNTSFLMLHKYYFLALSWMIEKLGNIKDEGLLLTGLCEALMQSTGCTEEEALKKACLQLGRKQRLMREILDDAEAITKTFFEEENLKHLLAGIKTTSR
jgi:hypothetical protein